MFHSGPTWGTKDEERMGKLLYNCFKEVVNIFCRPPEWIRNVQMIPGFSTRWECGWKSCMANPEDNTITDPIVIAENFNNFFTSIGTKL